MEELGAKVRAARIAQRYDVKAAAAGAEISRDTWKRVENGLGVQDVKRAAVLDFLGLDQLGNPTSAKSANSGTVSGNPDDETSLLYRRPDGLSDAEWERLKAETRGYLEWQIEKVARERNQT